MPMQKLNNLWLFSSRVTTLYFVSDALSEDFISL